MFVAKYFIWFALILALGTVGGEPTVPVIYAQDYCHYATINHKIHVLEGLQSLIVRAHRGPYRPGLDCQFRLVNDGPNGTGFNIVVNHIALKSSRFQKDYLVVKFNENKSRLWFDDRLIGSNRNENFFHTTASDDHKEVVFKFVATVDNKPDFKHNEDKGFEIIVSLFKPKDSLWSQQIDSDSESECPKKFSFDCGNNVCINQKQVCNGVDNCGNGADEPENCKHSRNNNYFDVFDNGFWFGFKIVMILLLIGVLLGIVSCICKTYDENKKLKREFLLRELRRDSAYRLKGNSLYHSLNQKKTPLYPQLYRTYGGTDSA